MTVNGWFQILLFLALIFAITKPMGVYMARVLPANIHFLIRSPAHLKGSCIA